MPGMGPGGPGGGPGGGFGGFGGGPHGGPGPGGHGPGFGGPHGGPHGPMGGPGFMHGGYYGMPGAGYGPRGAHRGGRFLIFPLFHRGRESGASNAITDKDENRVPTRTVKYIDDNGIAHTRIEYLNEKTVRRENSLWIRFKRWFKLNFTI